MRPDPTNITTYQDNLLRAFKSNSEQVLKQFYQAHYHKTEQYILNNKGTKEEAKDIYQEAFVAVWRNVQLGKFVPQHETALSAYLYRVSKNKWLDHLRSSRQHYTTELKDIENEPADNTDVSEAELEYLKQVKHHFAKLGETCKDILKRFYYLKQSMKAIATANNWTEATAKNNKYRCLQQLRSMFKPSAD